MPASCRFVRAGLSHAPAAPVVTLRAPPCDTPVPSFGACSQAQPHSRCSASTAVGVTVEADIHPGLPVVHDRRACPTPRCRSRASGCGRRSSTRASSSRCGASPSTWRRPTCARRARLRPGAGGRAAGRVGAGRRRARWHGCARDAASSGWTGRCAACGARSRWRMPARRGRCRRADRARATARRRRALVEGVEVLRRRDAARAG